jgi:RimJ/RimL family protein N-acetyltransferase
MHPLAEIWPPYGVRIGAGEDLVLTGMTDEDLPELARLVVGGIHAPDRMPFAIPWTDAKPQDVPANLMRFYGSLRAGLTPERFTLAFAVRVHGELVGSQSFSADNFGTTRTGETGSWLGLRFQGAGIGTRMRQAVCAFAFDHLGATEMTSGAFLDNPASLAVSRKVGYLPNGTERKVRRPGEVVVHQRLVLTPASFVRGTPIEVAGAEELRAFLRIGSDGAAVDT